MITKFDSLFAGHIDMDNVGYGGIPVNDRRFPNEHLATVFDKAQAMAQLMDRLGYSTFWMAEHHFQREGYECIPNVLMMALHLAHVTERLKIGCGFNIEEQVDIIFKAFNEESFSHRGKHYTLPPQVPYRGYTLEELTVVPRPLRLPVECWQPIQGGTARAMDFMAKHGIQGLIGGGSAEGGAMHKVVLGWQEAHARRGQRLEMGERLCFGFHFYLANSREQGIREAAKYYEENLKMFGELRLVRALSDEQIEIMRDPKRAPTAKLPRIEDAIANGGVLCGSPEQIIDHLKSLERRYPGLDRVSVSLSVGVPKAVALEQLEWFGTEVMPAFKQVKVAEPAMAK